MQKILENNQKKVFIPFFSQYLTLIGWSEHFLDQAQHWFVDERTIGVQNITFIGWLKEQVGLIEWEVLMLNIWLKIK